MRISACIIFRPASVPESAREATTDTARLGPIFIYTRAPPPFPPNKFTQTQTHRNPAIARHGRLENRGDGRLLLHPEKLEDAAGSLVPVAGARGRGGRKKSRRDEVHERISDPRAIASHYYMEIRDHRRSSRSAAGRPPSNSCKMV